MNFIAYRVICAPTGKCYIGITSQGIARRWAQHISQSWSAKTKFGRAIRKYGRASFEIEEVAGARNYEDLKALEIQLIKQEDSYRYGLNSTTGGDGAVGHRHDSESRARMRAGQALAAKRPETHERRAIAQREVWANKSEAELEAHRLRAAETMRLNLKAMPKRARKPKLSPLLGKGHNMRIKTHCPQGHPYEGENLLVDARGGRNCRICKRATRNKARNQRRAENRAADGGKSY